MSDLDEHALDGLAPDVDMIASRALFKRRRARRRTQRRLALVGASLAVVLVASAAVVSLMKDDDDRADELETVGQPTTVVTVPPIDTVRTLEDTGNGLSVTLQPSWVLAPGPLTLTNFQRGAVSMADPAEVFSFGTGPLYYGIDPTCEVANLPVATLDAMAPDEVLVQLLERRLRGTPDLPLRPEHFNEETVPGWENSCADPPATMHRLWFKADGGGDPAMEREIGVLVVIGDTAPQATVDELWATLDAMEIEPMANTREVLQLEVPDDFRQFVRTERSDAALDAIPFAAYPWFQIDSWEGGEGNITGDRWLVVAVARDPGVEWLERTVTPDLAEELTASPNGVTHDADEIPMLGIERERGGEPMRWRWWVPEEGYVALAIGIDVTAEEIESVTASASWADRRIEPGAFWLAPYPAGCFPVTPRPPVQLENLYDPTLELPSATATSLERALYTLGIGQMSFGVGPDPAAAAELIERDGDVWLRRDANGNPNLDNGEVETVAEHGVQLQLITPEHTADLGSPMNVAGVPATVSTCWPDD